MLVEGAIAEAVGRGCAVELTVCRAGPGGVEGRFSEQRRIPALPFSATQVIVIAPPPTVVAMMKV